MLMGRQKLQVFVSSTYQDLMDERQAAVSAILKAGHIPAGMELFASGDQSQMEVIKRWIDDSDVFALILGGRYGSVENSSGLSYTELEYNYALSQGKPLFALVLSDDAINAKVKLSGLSATETEHPKMLAEFRSRVMSKMCAICSDPKDIRGGVYESLLEIMQTRDLLGWVRVDSVVDPKPLHTEIAALKADNERLTSELDQLRLLATSSDPSTVNTIEFEEMKAVLTAKELVMPPEVTGKSTELKQNAFGLFRVNRNLFVKGWLVSPSPTGRLAWMHDNLFPVLTVHRLISSEKTPAGYIRYSATERALDFLAWLDRVAASKLARASSEAKPDQASEATAAPKRGSRPKGKAAEG